MFIDAAVCAPNLSMKTKIGENGKDAALDARATIEKSPEPLSYTRRRSVGHRPRRGCVAAN